MSQVVAAVPGVQLEVRLEGDASDLGMVERTVELGPVEGAQEPRPPPVKGPPVATMGIRVELS